MLMIFVMILAIQIKSYVILNLNGVCTSIVILMRKQWEIWS